MGSPTMVPLIGVTGRRFSTRVPYPELHPVLDGQTVDTYFSVYAARLAEAGAVAVFLPREANPRAVVGRLDGLILAGGLDIDPDMYGGEVTAASTAHDRAQDQFDVELTRQALAAGIPVLGTCRGHEVLNVACGGTVGDIDSDVHNSRRLPAQTRTHEVAPVAGSVLAELYGDSVFVNSLHHQAVQELGSGIVVTATAPDGVIEGIEVAGRDAIGVQWHPEMLHPVDPVFFWLADRARSAAKLKERAS